LTYAARRVGLALAAGIAAALALGLALAIAQGESILLWFAYMLDIAGAIAVAFALFSAAPTSARKAVSRRYLKKEDEDEAPLEGPPIVGDLMLFAGAGVILLVLGLLVELAA
jgi:hypothetical protein